MKNKIKHFFYLISVCLTIIYIFYRIFFTFPYRLNIISIVLGLILLLTEIWESFDFFIYYYNILSKSSNKKQPINNNLTTFPDLDILIATLNEDESLLSNTITSCLNLNYPKEKLHIYLCDDGHRENIKQLAKRLNINYISRPGNQNAKAGNYNYALSRTYSPYIVTFDADMQPTPEFLNITLPYILNSNEKVGFVQLPQSFNNPDIFQYRFKLYNDIPFEQEYFYHSLQLIKNESNSTVCCGTNTLFSREALQATNGFATGTISEDIATGMLIEAHGYHVIALDNIAAYGQTPIDLDSFLKQRSRWSRGCVQMLKKYKIITLKGLSIRQKLEYLSCVSYWFFGLKRLIFLLAPILFSLFGITVIDCNLLTFLSLWIPTYLTKRFLIDFLEGNKRSSTWNTIYEIILSPVLALNVLKECFNSKPTKFEVTKKNLSNTSNKMSKANLKLFYSHFVLFLLNLLSLIICIIKLTPSTLSLYVLSLFWNTVNCFYLIIAIIFDMRFKNYNFKDFVPNKTKVYKRSSVLKIFV